MRCFQCLQRVNNPEDLFDHLRIVHKIKGNYDYKCCFCPSEFDASGSFKTHIRNCYKKNKEKNQVEQPEETSMDEAFEIHHDMAMEYLDIVADFKDLVRKSALNMILKMSANMNIPRNLVFNQINDFEMFIKNTIVHGTPIQINSIQFFSSLKIDFLLHRPKNHSNSACKIGRPKYSEAFYQSS